jgi:FtsP/CotA-like multicopper oxidase with cupredoxin domain
MNAIEFDSAVTFHLHANLFDGFPTGRTLKPTLNTDVIIMGTAEHHILEFFDPYPGKYMFHPHQDHIADLGCMGVFEMLDRS